MTDVHVDLRKPQRNTLDRKAVEGAVEASLFRRAIEGDAFVLVTSFVQVLIDGQADLILSPSSGMNAWVIVERVKDGNTRIISVPDSQTTIEYTDLPDVDPATLDPIPSAVAAWQVIADQVAALGTSNATVLGMVQAARVPETIIVGNVARDANEVVTTADVRWPDGAPGQFIVDSNDASGAINGYHITHGSPVNSTYTQPAVSRDAAGAVTVIPPIGVS